MSETWLRNDGDAVEMAVHFLNSLHDVGRLHFLNPMSWYPDYCRAVEEKSWMVLKLLG